MSEKVIYEREVKSLTTNDIDAAISYSQSRAIIGKVAEWRDRKTVGLTIRIGLKAEGMALWVKTLLAAYAKEQRKFRDLRSTTLAA